MFVTECFLIKIHDIELKKCKSNKLVIVDTTAALLCILSVNSILGRWLAL